MRYHDPLLPEDDFLCIGEFVVRGGVFKKD